jgi:hypothetical protein
VNARLTGVGSVFAAGSRARTANVCAPGASAGGTYGGVHAVNGAESRLHSKLDPASLAENLNSGVALVVVSGGPESSVVSGGVLSTATPYWPELTATVSEVVDADRA